MQSKNLKRFNLDSLGNEAKACFLERQASETWYQAQEERFTRRIGGMCTSPTFTLATDQQQMTASAYKPPQALARALFLGPRAPAKESKRPPSLPAPKYLQEREPLPFRSKHPSDHARPQPAASDYVQPFQVSSTRIPAAPPLDGGQPSAPLNTATPVSYTHLTLPTILRV